MVTRTRTAVLAVGLLGLGTHLVGCDGLVGPEQPPLPTAGGQDTGGSDPTTTAVGSTGPIDPSTSSTTTTAGGTSDPDTAGIDPPDDDHNLVRLQLLRAPGQPPSVFEATTSIVVSLDYDTCLSSFYADAPDWAQTGASGNAVFDNWESVLCNLGDPAGPIDCVTTTVFQDLDAGRMTITYHLNQPVLDTRVIPFGPLPEIGLAACGMTEAPIVVTHASSVVGRNAASATIWEGTVYMPDRAASGQVNPILVQVAAQ